MIKKDDILVYAQYLEPGDDRCLKIALDDEFTPANVPFVRVGELNTWTLGCVNCFEAKYYKVVGHKRPNDTQESLVKRYLPENKWEYTRDLYQRNREK